MKLQAKFTLNFILLVMITILVSFFVINWNMQSQFDRFVKEKNQQWQRDHNAQQSNEQDVNNYPLESPFANPPIAGRAETPEQSYLKTVSNSLIWAGLIDVLFAVILAYLLSNLLLRRIYGLKDSMRRYMQDGASRPVAHESDDEVDELARIYNLLIEKIDKQEEIRKGFFIDMSHELRTPLTSVKGYLEGLLDGVFDHSKEREIHQKTLNETDRMIHLVREMTVLAKLESENSELKIEQTDLKKLSEEVVEMFAGQIEERALRTVLNGRVEDRVDVYKFKQVIINLLDNAIQYAPKNSTVIVEMEDSSKQIYWRIKNKLEGQVPVNLDNFFERFYRGDKSRSYDSKKPHLGIGLNIVRKIVEQHGAKIAVKMEDDQIVFEIVLIK